MKIAIIGAGPTGLTLAHQLTKNNIEVDIYDTAKEVGGFAKSIELWDKKIEIGPHFLSIGRMPAVENLILGALNGNYKTYKRQTFILTNKKIFQYPPSVSDILKKLNILQLTVVLGSVLKQSFIAKKADGTAEAFVKKHIGSYLYKYFFENFSRKLWGVSGKQVSDIFAKSLLGFNKGYSPLRVVYNKISTNFKAGAAVKDVYIYPNGGLSTLWDAIKEQTEAQGGKFFLSSQITGLSSDGKDQLTHLSLSDGIIKGYDFFVSTIPVLPFLNYLSEGMAAKVQPRTPVKFRSDVLLYLKVQYHSAKPGQCFYIYAEDIKITRVTNFNAFEGGVNDPFSVILLEFWCSKEDTVWTAEKSELLGIAATELEKTNLFKGLKIMDMAVKKVENAFQVPDLSYLENRDKLFDELTAYTNLKVTGRYASINFNYGMENAIDDGIKLGNEILAAEPYKYNLETTE